jgi:hypothetical protein
MPIPPLPSLQGSATRGLDHNPARKVLRKAFMETKTIMANAVDDPLVERLEIGGDHFATEPDNTKLYVPKESQHLINRFKGNDGLTSMQPRINLPGVQDNAVLNHTRVLVCESAATVERQRSLAQLQSMAKAGNEDAVTMLKALEGYVISNDSTVQPFDSTVQREWTGVWRRK